MMLHNACEAAMKFSGWPESHRGSHHDHTDSPETKNSSSQLSSGLLYCERLHKMLMAGTARENIDPFPGVELTGWGYYIERVWKKIHDSLNVTALAVESNDHAAVLISLDLMVIDRAFTNSVRQQICDATDISPTDILLTCTHTHNAPAAGGLLGVGACDPQYEEFAAKQAATAAIKAWDTRHKATVRTATTQLPHLTFNRTRASGEVDSTLTAALIEHENGDPISVVVNFAAHPTVAAELRPFHVSRDVPGLVCDLLEIDFPDANAIYIQGACGDTNFHTDFKTEERWRFPAIKIATTATTLLRSAEVSNDSTVAADSRRVRLPVRRWSRAEIEQDREEAVRRLAESDFTNWRDTIGRCMTNRPDDMVARHGGNEEKAVRAMCRFQIEWTDQILQDLETRPEHLETEVQSLRIGPLTIVSNASEFFSPFALQIREQAEPTALMVACYSNGRIGYLPDAHDIDARSYAGYQSPKYCNQFPFTAESGPAMCAAMLSSIAATNQS